MRGIGRERERQRQRERERDRETLGSLDHYGRDQTVKASAKKVFENFPINVTDLIALCTHHDRTCRIDKVSSGLRVSIDGINRC